MTRPSPTPFQRIDTVEDALAWMRERRGLYLGQIGDVCTVILGRWEGRERAHDDAVHRLQVQRDGAARLHNFLGWAGRELDALDAAWDQLEDQAAAMYFEAEEVLNPETNEETAG